MNKLAIPFFLIFIAGTLSGQPAFRNEQGLPFLKNYTATDYKAHAQNFAIVRNQGGIVYAGNFAGVLQFDGKSWRLIPTEKTTRVSALCVDAGGTVYVGALGEIGCLVSGPRGTMTYKSLIDSTASAPAFQDVLQIFSTSDGIYFITRKVIFRWNQGKLENWKADYEVLNGFYVNQTLYFQVKDRGLMIFRNGEIDPVAKGDLMTGAIEIRAMLPYSGNQVLLATGTQGLYLADAAGVRKFANPADQLFMENLITSGVALSDGTYAIGTSRKGVIVIYPDGRIKQVIDKTASLRNEYVQALYADESNILWAALNNGIAMIETPSALSFFDEKSGLNGAVIQILRHQGRLYVSTYQGLFLYRPESFSFESVPQIITACWSLIPFGNDLLAATSEGVFQVSGNGVKRVKEGFVLSLTVSATDQNLVYGGDMTGLFSMKYQGGAWKSTNLAASEEEIKDLVEDQSGSIWGSTLSKGIFRFSPKTGSMEFFNESTGFAQTVGGTINLIGKNIAISTRKGVLRFDENTRSFSTVNLVNQKDTSAEVPWYSIIREDQKGNLWVNAGDESHLMLLRKNADSFEPWQLPFLPINNYVIWDIFPEVDEVTWFGGPDGLIRYDPSVKTLKPDPQPTMIRQITTPADSLIFAGNQTIDPASSNETTIFKYNDNSLRFEFSVPFCAAKGENQYQYQLEGFEDTWSDWTPETQKEYTSLPKGKFTFRVKARNVYGVVATEASFRFDVLAPWYNTIWSYILYILLASAIIYLILVLRNRQLIKEKRILEQRIEDRTAEVVQQKEEIMKQSDELASKNDELEKINNTVKAINQEIKFETLLQSLMEKMKVIKSVEKATALVYDKNDDIFKFTASFGWDMEALAKQRFTLEQAEQRYLGNSQEIFEDVFLRTDFKTWEYLTGLGSIALPKSMLVMVIRVENRVEAFLLLQNINKEHAFEAKDLSFVRNAKEHIISAFIRTRIMQDLQQTLQNLKEAQDQLVQSEKLASLGALIAGIAHEIQNPLNFVNNFSSLSADLAEELLESLEKAKEVLDEDTYADIQEVVTMIKGNVTKIHDHGKRAESIVKGMLQHSRAKSGEFEMTAINNMVSEYVNLAYHGMRAKDKDFNTAIRTELDPEVDKAAIIPQDLSRVVLNIVNNSCYALDEKIKKNIPGFKPEVVVSTKKIKDKIEIRIRDNGTGIPDHVKEKIFNPFFTTKPAGSGTGLGLSLSYDIVTQIHKGKLEVNSQDGEFTEFIITIPEKQT
jgi:signal transduction histidine kinase/ligand-binding sensor domain-containing protein